MTSMSAESDSFVLTEYRRAVFGEILNVHKKIPNYSRSSQFLAISILDKYVEFYREKKIMKSSPPQDSYICALVCLFVSSKFNGTDEPILQKYLEGENSLKTKNQFRQKIFESEGIILETIEFEVPLETPLTHLQFAIKEDIEEKKSRRQFLVKCVKMLLLSLEIENTLSKTPIIGREIYQLLKSGSGTRRVVQIYQNIRKCQSQKTN